MPILVQFRRANTTMLSTYAGANGEMVINTDDRSLTVHDGTTLGGFTLPSIKPVTVASGVSITPDADAASIVTQLNTAAGGTLTINAPIGTPIDCQSLTLRVKCTNVQTLSWNAAYAGSTDQALPSATSGSGKYDYAEFIYNSDVSKWHLVNKKFGF
jgi:hypothetical protein